MEYKNGIRGDIKMSNEKVEIWFDDIIHETANAWLLDIDGEKVWMPKSQCELDGDMVLVPEWLAIEKDLI